MNFLEKLKNDIPQFDWKHDPYTDSYMGYANIEPYKIIDKDKNTSINSSKVIFISGELYAGTPESFRYSIAYQVQKFRKYRHNFFIDVEANKTYASGKTLDIIYDKLFSNSNFIKFIIQK